MENPIDPTAGFDGALPDFSYIDDMQAELTGGMNEIAGEFDEIATCLDEFCKQGISDIENDIVEMRVAAFDAVDKPTQSVKKAAAGVTANLTEMLDTELATLASDVATLPKPTQPANPLIFPPEQPTPEPPQTPTQPPKPLPPEQQQPPIPQPPQQQPPAQIPLVVSTNDPNHRAILCEYCGTQEDIDAHNYAMVQYHASNVPFFYDAESEFLQFAGQNAILFYDGSPSVGYMSLFQCAACYQQQPPTTPPTTPPTAPPTTQPPIPSAPMPDWVAQLCECLTAKKSKPLKVWLRCSDCDIVVSEADAEPPSDDHIVVVEIDEEGNAVYVAACVDEEQQPEGEELPVVPPELEVLLQAICKMPKAIIGKADTANNFAVGSYAMGLAFGTLALIPQNALASIKPDGALVALAALFGMMGQSVERAQAAAAQMGCNEDTRRLIVARQILGLFERVLPGGFGEAIARQTQRINEQCPSLLPTVDQANAAYLGDTITEDVWRCWIRANGYVDEDMDNVLRALRSRPAIRDVIMLWRKGVIGQQEMIDRLRDSGVVDNDDRQRFIDATEQVPTLSDIIRFMVRDADDINVVQQFGLDDEFQNKYGGQLKQWAEAQGIPDIVAQYAWRSHWTIPSPTQLYEMFHRLGRDANGKPIPQFQKYVKDALIQQDILPFWVDKLLDVSYTLPTRVDIRRGYRVGVYTEQDVREQYIKRGYDDKTVDALVRFATFEKRSSWANNKYVAKYAKGQLTEQELKDVLTRFGATQDAIDFAVITGKYQQRADRRDKCLRAIRRRVFLGELTKAETEQEIQALGLDVITAGELMAKYFCERDAASRELTLRQVLALFNEQVIDSAELFTRLINLRYSPADATVLVERVSKQLQRKIDDAERKRLEKERKAAERAAREAVRNTQKGEKNRERTAKAREAAARAERSREVRIMEAAKALANRIDVQPTDVYGPMVGVYRRIVRSGFAAADKVAQAAVKSAGADVVKDLQAWEDNLIGLLSS